MLYSKIAQSLQEISTSPPAKKAQICAALLEQADPDMLCPLVRLLSGELWPRWEEREMGMGPEAVAAALTEVSLLSEHDISLLRQAGPDMGAVAETALSRKTQNSLSTEPLQAQLVYDVLLQVSRQSGKESEQRKAALLRGLFLQASPLEGRFIARAALRSMQAGIGQKTLISALAATLHCDRETILRAYSLLPDLGLVAQAAGMGDLDKIAMQPSVPVRFMHYTRCRAKDEGGSSDGSPSAAASATSSVILPVYPGLRVQFHRLKGEASVFTTQYRPITVACSGIVSQIAEMDADFIIDAYLMGFRGAKQGGSEGIAICSSREMLRYINRRRLSRKSSLSPSLLVYDLLFLDGSSLCSLPYWVRRSRLVGLLGEPRAMPFSGISTVGELPGEAGEDADILAEVRKGGGKALLVRDIEGEYLPAEASRTDCIIR